MNDFEKQIIEQDFNLVETFICPHSKKIFCYYIKTFDWNDNDWEKRQCCDDCFNKHIMNWQGVPGYLRFFKNGINHTKTFEYDDIENEILGDDYLLSKREIYINKLIELLEDSPDDHMIHYISHFDFKLSPNVNNFVNNFDNHILVKMIEYMIDYRQE